MFDRNTNVLRYLRMDICCSEHIFLFFNHNFTHKKPSQTNYKMAIELGHEWTSILGYFKGHINTWQKRELIELYLFNNHISRIIRFISFSELLPCYCATVQCTYQSIVLRPSQVIVLALVWRCRLINRGLSISVELWFDFNVRRMIGRLEIRKLRCL